MPLPEISIRAHGGLTAAACVELAQAAESSGFEAVWFAENAFARSIVPAATACALGTRRLNIGVGVFNPYSRHPTMMAMEVGAIDELSDRRVSLSIGAGILAATEGMGFDVSRPVPAVRDALAIVRALLAGGVVDYEGPAFSARNIKLDYTPRPDIPILIAGRGKLMVKLAGEVADGLIVSNMCSLAFARDLAKLMQEARQDAGRPRGGKVVQYMPCAVGEDRDAATAAGKRAVGEMVPAFWALGQKLGSAKDALLGGTEISEVEFATAAARLRAGEDAANVLDERYTAAFSLTGTPGECLDAASRYGQAGVTELALTFSGAGALNGIAALGTALRRKRSAPLQL